MQLDLMAQRYSCRPSDILRQSPFDLTVDFLCAREGKRHQDSILRRIQGGKEPVFPVVIVGKVGG